MIQIALVEIRQPHQPVQVMDLDLSILEGGEAVLSQDAVDVNGTQSQCVREQVLRQRAGVTLRRSEPDQLQPSAQLQQKMRRALLGIASPDAHEVLDEHGLVRGGRPQDSRREARGLAESFQNRSMASTEVARFV